MLAKRPWRVPRTRPECHAVFTAACGVKLATRQSGAFDGKKASTWESETRHMLRCTHAVSG